jgi:hypothetical protein
MVKRKRFALPERDHVTVKELMRVCRVSREKVHEWIEEGWLLPAYDLRGKGASRSLIRIPRAVVVEFLESRRERTVTRFTSHAAV